MSDHLRVRLLGGFRLERAGEAVPLGSPRLQALLAFLVLHRGDLLSRRHLAFLFWPDSGDAQAQTNLRQLLHRLRSALPEAGDWLHGDRRTLQWAPPAEVEVDLAGLEAAWEEAERASAEGRMSAAVAAAERASSLYRGDLLPDCYDDWIEPHREGIRRATISGMQRLIGWLEERREWRAALAHAHRLVELDPLQEGAHRAVMRLHALAGDPALAVRAYATCAEFLARELDAEPSEETRALLARLRDGAPPEGVGAAEEMGPAGGPGPAEGDGEPREGAIPLLGRHEDWRRLVSTWEGAARGRPGFVLVRGEAGVGKTRLAEAFLEWAGGQGAATARARCWAAEGRLPFEPVAQWLRSPSLEAGVPALQPIWRSEVARLLPDLAGPVAGAARAGPAADSAPAVPAADAAPAGSGGAEGRLRLFEALARAVGAVERPVLLMLDDVHWCDGDTLEWLHYLLRSRPDAPFMGIATLRSGEPAADARLDRWLLRLQETDSLVELELGPLTAEDTAALATALRGRPVGEDEARALYMETEGNPLFVVEVIRRWSRAAGGDGVGGRRAAEEAERPDLPARVRAVIRGRLGLLSPEASELIALLAVIGRDFTLDVLRLAAPGDPGPVVRALEELVQRHLIREQGEGAHDFSHDKIREVAYAELSDARRRVLHERVSRALEGAHAAAPDEAAGEIARHLERAGLREAAIPWRRRAASRALTLYANQEAAEHLERALELLREQPETRERIEREIELETARGVPLVLMDHYTGTRAWTAYARASELSEGIGRPVDPPVLRALALHNLARSRLTEVSRLAGLLMEAAEADPDPMLRVEAHYVMGVTRYWRGDAPGARRHLARALELYRPERLAAHLQLFAQDPWTVCSVRLALAEWQMGRLAQLPQGETAGAVRRCLDALERAEVLGHPFTVGYARCFASWVFIEAGEVAVARYHVAAMRRERDPGLRTWWAMAGILEGYLLAEAGNPQDGLACLEEAALAYGEAGNTLGTPYHQGLRARVLRRLGRPDQAIAAVDAGLAVGERMGERFWDGELLRLRGELAEEAGAFRTAPG